MFTTHRHSTMKLHLCCFLLTGATLHAMSEMNQYNARVLLQGTSKDGTLAGEDMEQKMQCFTDALKLITGTYTALQDCSPYNPYYLKSFTIHSKLLSSTEYAEHKEALAKLNTHYGMQEEEPEIVPRTLGWGEWLASPVWAPSVAHEHPIAFKQPMGIPALMAIYRCAPEVASIEPCKLAQTDNGGDIFLRKAKKASDFNLLFCKEGAKTIVCTCSKYGTIKSSFESQTREQLRAVQDKAQAGINPLEAQAIYDRIMKKYAAPTILPPKKDVKQQDL